MLCRSKQRVYRIDFQILRGRDPAQGIQHKKKENVFKKWLQFICKAGFYRQNKYKKTLIVKIPI
jgi:hypothetical protein